MNSKVICAVFALALCALVQAGPVAEDNKGNIENTVVTHEQTVEESLLKKLNSKCANRDISSCMMLKLVTYFNRMLKKSHIELGDVEITQTSTETFKAETSRSIGTENMSEEAQFSQVIADKIQSFLKTRSLKWKVVDGADVVVSGNEEKDGSVNLGVSLHPNESTDNGDARKKKDNGMGAIIAAAVMKIGLLKALAFKALVLLVGKALLVSKLALVLAAVIGLKKLLHSEKHVTYEVVAHPHHEHHEEHHHSGGGHDSYGGGWGRNFDAKEAQKLAYSAQIPAN